MEGIRVWVGIAAVILLLGGGGTAGFLIGMDSESDSGPAPAPPATVS